MKNILKLIGDLSHQLQKERGASVLFLDSSGKKFAKEIEDCFLSVDEIIVNFKKESILWKNNKTFKKGILSKLNIILQNISKLKEYRSKILSLSITVPKTINFYTYEIISHLIDIAVQIAFFNPETDSDKITAYSNFLFWKERVGRERAVGVRGFLLDKFDNKEFIERIDSLIQEQSSYKKTFLAFADDYQRKSLDKIMGHHVIDRLDNFHQEIERNQISPTLKEMTAEEWYQLISKKIDLMYQIELALIETLEKKQSKPQENCFISSLSKKNHDFIRTLPFFIGLPEKSLSELLQYAQTKEYSKGKILFLEGEHSTRFYIILEGWVKLFKNTVSGDETILQMLTSGDVFSETTIFLNSLHTINAQVAEDAKLLTFPAPIIREYIRNNNKFAVNMLTSMSLRSQILIHQVESIKLKSVKERVGWFLLKLLIEEGDCAGAIKLPYDKAMIASYLNMKPETFSRTLKSFKEEGFRIENDTVILSDISSLCAFCNTDTKHQCSRHGTIDCPRYECSNKVSYG